MEAAIRIYEATVINASAAGYDGRTNNERWNYPAALMFCLSVFTMIGYGNLVPRTEWGKAMTIAYAVLGIPLYILYFMNMGKVLAQTFKWSYRKIRGPSKRQDTDVPVVVNVPVTACIWVIVFYVASGTIMFAEWEEWGYLDSTYFCMTSLCKIGMGDFVPGTNILESQHGNQSKLIINFVYLLLGMGIVAMCYHLLKQEVLQWIHDIKEDIRDYFSRICFKIRRS